MILRRIAEQREKLILSKATPYLEPGEEVKAWVRTRTVGGRDDGIAFLTPRRCVVHWTRGDDPGSFAWDEIEAWGLATEYPAGPVLGVESETSICFVQIRVDTPAMAEAAENFIEGFRGLAEAPRRPLTRSGKLETAEFHTTEGVKLSPPVLSPWDRARRLIITLLGAVMIVGALLIIPLPGPWSFLIAIAGFAVLAREYDWAKDALDWIRRRYREVRERLGPRRGPVSVLVGAIVAIFVLIAGFYTGARAFGESPRRIVCDVLPHSEGSWLGRQCEDA